MLNDNIDSEESILRKLESEKKILCDKLQTLIWCDGLSDNSDAINETNKQISDIDKLIKHKQENLNMLLSPIVEDYNSSAKDAKVVERNRFKSVAKPKVAYQNAMRRRERNTYVPENRPPENRSFFLFFWWGN